MGGAGGPVNEVQAAALQVNDSAAAILQHVPLNLHKFLTGRPKNQTTGEQEIGFDSTTTTNTFQSLQTPIMERKARGRGCRR